MLAVPSPWAVCSGESPMDHFPTLKSVCRCPLCSKAFPDHRLKWHGLSLCPHCASPYSPSPHLLIKGTVSLYSGSPMTGALILPPPSGVGYIASRVQLIFIDGRTQPPTFLVLQQRNQLSPYPKPVIYLCSESHPFCLEAL